MDLARHLPIVLSSTDLLAGVCRAAGRITSHHPWLAKLVAMVMGLEATGEIAITAVLPAWRANGPSIFSAPQIARAAKSAVVIALVLLGAPVTASAQLPDMRPEVSSVHVELQQNVVLGDVAEGCAGGTNGRDLVRLDLITRNDGPGPVVVGDPMCPNCATHSGEICANPDFICSPAGGHNHPHYQNFLRYEIVDPNDVVVATGGKRSFCLAESSCDPGHSGGHTCTNQGLNAQCEDLYPYWLGCQYVDVTDVPDGTYSLRVTVDPQNRFAETNEMNNVIEQEVVLERALPDDGDHLLEGGSLFLKADRILRFNAKAPEDIDLRGASNDPTIDGATLYLFDSVSGNGIPFGLRAEGWKRIGKGATPRGFRFRGDGREFNECLSVEITRRGMRVRCNLKGEHTHFSLPAPGKILVQLLVGTSERRLCANFGGREQRNDEILLKRRNSLPGDCDYGE